MGHHFYVDNDAIFAICGYCSTLSVFMDASKCDANTQDRCDSRFSQPVSQCAGFFASSLYLLKPLKSIKHKSTTSHFQDFIPLNVIYLFHSCECAFAQPFTFELALILYRFVSSYRFADFGWTWTFAIPTPEIIAFSGAQFIWKIRWVFNANLKPVIFSVVKQAKRFRIP